MLSGLGPPSKSDAGIASQGTRAIVHAMEPTDVRRVVVVSAAPIGQPWRRTMVQSRPLTRKIVGRTDNDNQSQISNP